MKKLIAIALILVASPAYASPEIVDSIRMFIRTSESMLAVNKMLARDDLGEIPSIPPTAGIITSSFGMRVHPIWHVRCFHAGLDIHNKEGTPVVAPGGGVVVFAGRSRAYDGYGNVVVIEHSPRVRTMVAHLETVLVHEGDRVTRGEVVGTMGMTGTATGFHVHYEVIVEGVHVDPREWIL